MKKVLSTIIIWVGLVAIFWNQPVYRQYKISTRGQLDGFRILFLSDLHNTEYGKNQQGLLKMIDKAKPDIILFGGDIADEKSSIEPVEKLLQGLKQYDSMYYVMGNHEYWVDKTEDVQQLFSDYGVKLLLDETLQIKTEKGHISLLGLNDPDYEMRHSDRRTIRKSISQAYEPELMEGYKILLSHRPEHIQTYMDYKFDLILSGHAHGGQVRIPGLINGLYAPNQGFLPSYAGGHYLVEETDFIVSRGLSFRKALPRIMNPPELVIIDLVK